MSIAIYNILLLSDRACKRNSSIDNAAVHKRGKGSTDKRRKTQACIQREKLRRRVKSEKNKRRGQKLARGRVSFVVFQRHALLADIVPSRGFQAKFALSSLGVSPPVYTCRHTPASAHTFYLVERAVNGTRSSRNFLIFPPSSRIMQV